MSLSLPPSFLLSAFGSFPFLFFSLSLCLALFVFLLYTTVFLVYTKKPIDWKNKETKKPGGEKETNQRQGKHKKKKKLKKKKKPLEKLTGEAYKNITV